MEWLVQFFPALVLAAVGVVHHVSWARPLRRLRRGVTLMGRGYPEALMEFKGPPHIRELARSVWSLGREVETRMRGLVEAEQRGRQIQAEGPARAASGTAPAPTEGADHAHDAPVNPLVAVDPVLERLRQRCLDLEQGEASDPTVRALAREVWARDVELAARRGDLPLRSRLDDAALKVLNRSAYDHVVARLARAARTTAGRLVAQRAAVAEALSSRGIAFETIDYRVKHVAGIWRKMKALGLPFEQVQDVFGLRVVVADECDCYRTLAVLHQVFEPQLFSFDDYIAHPKPNGYRSLHTHLLLPEGARVEAQIRTVEMHRAAEHGRGAESHWRYKAGRRAEAAGRAA